MNQILHFPSLAINELSSCSSSFARPIASLLTSSSWSRSSGVVDNGSNSSMDPVFVGTFNERIISNLGAEGPGAREGPRNTVILRCRSSFFPSLPGSPRPRVGEPAASFPFRKRGGYAGVLGRRGLNVMLDGMRWWGLEGEGRAVAFSGDFLGER